jgi:hypothetical protein
MVVERYISRFAASPIPAEEQPPLLIHADGMETIQLSFQFLKVMPNFSQKPFRYAAVAAAQFEAVPTITHPQGR